MFAWAAQLVRAGIPSQFLFWSLEGSQWTWDTYVGAPDMLATLAPEMDGIVDTLMSMVTKVRVAPLPPIIGIHLD
jgi:hypothetical protein